VIKRIDVILGRNRIFICLKECYTCVLYVWLRGSEEVEQALCKLNYFGATQFGLSVDSVNKRNWHLPYRVIELSSSDYHLHLEHVSLRYARLYQLLQHLLLIQSAITKSEDIWASAEL